MGRQWCGAANDPQKLFAGDVPVFDRCMGVENTCKRTVYKMAVGAKNAKEFDTSGWWTLRPNQVTKICFSGRINAADMYWHFAVANGGAAYSSWRASAGLGRNPHLQVPAFRQLLLADSAGRVDAELCAAPFTQAYQLPNGTWVSRGPDSFELTHTIADTDKKTCIYGAELRQFWHMKDPANRTVGGMPDFILPLVMCELD